MSYDYLEHHGILGQKWGVRRYQNQDGSLTDAGKKRYYESDGRGDLQKLTKAGHEYNKQQREQYDRYKNSLASNVQKVNGQKFKDAKQRYLDANKKNNEHYLNEREKWFKQEGEYKNKDYYQFKDISADKWFRTRDSQDEQKAIKELTNMIEEAAKQHPLYNKSIKQLSEYSTSSQENPFYEIEIGKKVVSDVLFETVRSDAIKNQK